MNLDHVINNLMCLVEEMEHPPKRGQEYYQKAKDNIKKYGNQITRTLNFTNNNSAVIPDARGNFENLTPHTNNPTRTEYKQPGKMVDGLGSYLKSKNPSYNVSRGNGPDKQYSVHGLHIVKKSGYDNKPENTRIINLGRGGVSSFGRG